MGDGGLAWGFYNALVPADRLQAKADEVALQIATGPTFAHGVTKKLLHQEWAMGGWRGVSTTRWCRQIGCKPRRTKWRCKSRQVRRSLTASPRNCCIRNGRWGAGVGFLQRAGAGR